MMENLKRKGIIAFLWDYCGKVVTQGISFIVTIFLARLLDPSEFGLIAMIMVIIGIASVFTDVGLGSALIQRSKVLPVHYSSVFFFNVFFGLILTIITFFSAGWVSKFYQSDALIPLVQVLSITFLINALSSVQSTKLRKELNYAVITKASFIASLISGFVGIFLAFRGAGVWSLAAQKISSGVIYSALVWSLSKWRPSFLFSLKALMQLWGFGFRVFLSGVLDAIFTRLDYLIIGKLFQPDMLGFFQRAKSLNYMVVKYSSGSLLSVLFPILSKVKNDLPRFQKIILKMVGIISFLVFLLLGGLYLISEELIVFLFGEKWLPSVGFFQVLVFSGFGYPMSGIFLNVLRSKGKSKMFLHLEIYKKILVSINFFVLYAWGIDKYLYGLIIVAILGVLLNVLFAANEINVSFFRLIEPIIDQVVIVTAAVLTTLYFVIEVESELLIVVKSICFISIYILSNLILNTHSYRNISKQMKLIITK